MITYQQTFLLSGTSFFLFVQLEVWAKEDEDSLKKKWKKIEGFDAQKLELKSIYDALLRANTVMHLHYSITVRKSNYSNNFC